MTHDELAVMNKHYLEILLELEDLVVELSAAQGRRLTEEEVQAAEAPLLAERHELERRYVALRRGNDG